ncbi:MAG: hypothetical protein K2Y22_04360 [Candidatus Obscuribacterales bacterium]|nr:hypothetical protein [Candidatus Obscuribacterales bacterium]
MPDEEEKIKCRLCGKPADKVMLNEKKTFIGFMHGEGIKAIWHWTVKKEWKK